MAPLAALGRFPMFNATDQCVVCFYKSRRVTTNKFGAWLARTYALYQIFYTNKPCLPTALDSKDDGVLICLLASLISSIQETFIYHPLGDTTGLVIYVPCTQLRNQW
jgi:hypothetical protein